jgi:DHA1 family tetracycline resistance protein-like MFS transporter
MSAAQRPDRAVPFVLLTILIDTIGLGIVIPVLPQLVMELTGQGLSAAARWGGWLGFVYALMQFLCAPIIGNLSDRFGRRPVLLLSLSAFGLDYLIMGLSPTIWWLFLGRLVAGITGASYGTGMAFIADVTPVEQRAARFGLVGATFGTGFILGPAIGGYLGAIGHRVPFFAAAGLALLNVLYGLLVLPESLPLERRRPFALKGSSPLGTLARLRAHPTVLGLAVTLFLWVLAHQAMPSTWAYYTMLRFQWNERAVGLSLAAAGVSMVVVQGWLTRRAIPSLGERRAAQLGLALGTLGFLGYAAATRGWMMFAWMGVAALGGFVYPSLSALMSRLVDPSEQGALQGAMSSLQGLAAILGPPVMTQLFSLFTGPAAPIHLPGAAFIAAALLGVAALAMANRVTARASAG